MNDLFVSCHHRPVKLERFVNHLNFVPITAPNSLLRWRHLATLPPLTLYSGHPLNSWTVTCSFNLHSKLLTCTLNMPQSTSRPVTTTMPIGSPPTLSFCYPQCSYPYNITYPPTQLFFFWLIEPEGEGTIILDVLGLNYTQHHPTGLESLSTSRNPKLTNSCMIRNVHLILHDNITVFK
jgi:hypothetical protein